MKFLSLKAVEMNDHGIVNTLDCRTDPEVMTYQRGVSKQGTLSTKLREGMMIKRNRVKVYIAFPRYHDIGSDLIVDMLP